MGHREVIEIIFVLWLFINALSFIPQIIRIIREKSVKGVSLITFSIFLASQFSAVLYGLIIKSNILVLGYLFSMLTCAPVVLLILFFRRNKHELSEAETNLKDISFKDILDQLPVATPSEASLTLEKKHAIAENAPRILLVEDNSLIQNVTQGLLNGLGFVVDVAGTGAEAIEKFEPGKYALIYMNIGLPDQNGYYVTQVMREKEDCVNASAVPIIALTAHGAVDVEAFCGRAGMQGVLSKPLTREQAEAVWGKFGLRKSERVAGLTLIGHADATPQTGKIIDMDGTISLLGTKEYAEELLALWCDMLTQRFLPALKDFVEKRDDEALRQELHNMLGSLCYVKTPLLNQAVLDLQTAARNHPQSIESAYQHVLEEAQRFIKHYSAMTLTK